MVILVGGVWILHAMVERVVVVRWVSKQVKDDALILRSAVCVNF